MISYALSQQLKDSGFPQGKAHFYWSTHTDPETLWDINLVSNIPSDAITIAAPTLDELIAACGDGAFLMITNGKGIWAAAFNNKGAEGRTPDEAVAHLYLALHAE
jgi:hypothetical protein